MFDGLKRFNIFYNFTEMYRQEVKALKTLHSFSESVILNRRNELANSTGNTNEQSNDDNDMGIKKKTAFLDLLLQSSIDGQPLSTQDIREEVDTFMFEVNSKIKSTIASVFIINLCFNLSGSRYND